MTGIRGAAVLAAFALIGRAGDACGAPPTARTLTNPLGSDRAVTAPGILSAPLAWLGAAIRLPFRSHELPNSRPLDPEEGWSDLAFPVGEIAHGLYLEVRGRAEFESAEVRFADGSLRSLDLARAVRSRGLFELVAFDRTIAVAEVRLRARGLAPETRVGLRLGR